MPAHTRRPTHRPAIAGTGQLLQRVDDPCEAVEPIALMERALRAAAEDAGSTRLLEALDAIYVPQGLWRYGDPGALLAERLGLGPVHTAVGAISGHIVQILVNRACEEIAAGRREVIAIVGAESENSKRRLKRRDLPRGWDDQIPGEPNERFGEMKRGIHPHELQAGIVNATSCFSLCENSLRSSLGETPAAHRDRIADLYSRMSRVAASNPHAWIQREVPSKEIRDPSPGNRMVAYPYTKLMTSNISVDQGAALLICSEDAALRFGVARDRLVYLRASTEMNHTTYLSDRELLHRHPGQERAARRVLELAASSAEDLDYIDLYSCFPFAVQAGAHALGIGLDPVPSLTGGMTFFGGPFGNYVLHSTAELVERLRAAPGSVGAIGSVGGYFGHFSYGVYSSDPGEAAAPIIEDVSADYAALPVRPHVAEFDGSAEIESYTVDVRAAGPQHATFSALNSAGQRVWGRSEDPAVMQSLLADEDPCGATASIRAGRVDLD
jgi:acetyl-CoA C-acetyltransferase